MHIDLARGAAVALTGALLALGIGGCSSGEQVPRAAPDAEGRIDLDTANAQHEALDFYVEAERQVVAAMADTLGQTYSSVVVEALYPDTVAFSYVYLEQVDPDEARPFLDSIVPTLETACDTKIFPDMKAAGVTSSQKVIYTYYNADGSRLWTHTCQS